MTKVWAPWQGMPYALQAFGIAVLSSGDVFVSGGRTDMPGPTISSAALGIDLHGTRRAGVE
eukprot:m.440801 g.440801  ORF g.440801 m.440801 type:complete len:61 (-) comp124903_c0_seq1:309-491(-)